MCGLICCGYCEFYLYTSLCDWWYNPGCMLWSPEMERNEKRRVDQFERDFKIQSKKSRKEKCLLFVGENKSYVSPLIKYLRMHYTDSNCVPYHYCEQTINSVLQQVQCDLHFIINSMEELNINFSSEVAERSADKILDDKIELCNPSTINADSLKELQSVWKDEGLQKCYLSLKNSGNQGISRPETIEYLFDDNQINRVVYSGDFNQITEANCLPFNTSPAGSVSEVRVNLNGWVLRFVEFHITDKHFKKRGFLDSFEGVVFIGEKDSKCITGTEFITSDGSRINTTQHFKSILANQNLHEKIFVALDKRLKSLGDIVAGRNEQGEIRVKSNSPIKELVLQILPQ